MKKIVFFIAIFAFPFLLHSQAASGSTCIWEGGDDANWETPGNWEAGTCNDGSGNASYPATNDVTVKFDGSEADTGDTNRTITLAITLLSIKLYLVAEEVIKTGFLVALTYLKQ